MRASLTAGVAFAAFLAATGTAVANQATAPGQMKKIGASLEHLYKTGGGKAASEKGLKTADVLAGDYVVVDSVAKGNTKALEAKLRQLGARNISSYGRIVSAQVPVSSLGSLDLAPELSFARPSLATTDAGNVLSQGDRGMRTDEARATTGFDGTGMTVGVLSDSFSCRTTPVGPNGFTTTAQDIASNDLPATIINLSDLAPSPSACIDEGRGMAQLIHDNLPGAAIAFHTAFNGEADFANGIIELAVQAASDVVVDDVIYFAEPMFQDGIIAQAADEVTRLGVPYFSSNGNRARTAHRTAYRAENTTIGGLSGPWHDFDPGAGVDTLQTVRLTRASAGGIAQITLSFQWDEPNFSVSGAPGSASDVDVVMFDGAGNPVADCFPGGGPFVQPANGLCTFQNADGGVGGDAIELQNLVYIPAALPAPLSADVQIGFRTESGPAPNLVMHVPFVRAGAMTELEWATNSGSGYGHNNAAGAEGVGASAFAFNEEFIGDPFTVQLRACTPACLNDFSSAGGTPIVFDTAGVRLAAPVVRLKPGITAPDGGNTTFFTSDTFRDDDDHDGIFGTAEAGEFPNFFGTSAAAPNAASIAAMLLDKEGEPILRSKQNAKITYWMCAPGPNGRADGVTGNVEFSKVPNRLAQGHLLGRCTRSEPSVVIGTLRSTAQDMTERVNITTGAVIGTFPAGFDEDSGFGMVDAVAAVNAFTGN